MEFYCGAPFMVHPVHRCTPWLTGYDRSFWDQLVNKPGCNFSFFCKYFIILFQQTKMSQNEANFEIQAQSSDKSQHHLFQASSMVSHTGSRQSPHLQAPITVTGHICRIDVWLLCCYKAFSSIFFSHLFSLQLLVFFGFHFSFSFL